MPFTKITTIDIGPIPIQVWGLLVALGMLVALFITFSEAKRKKMNKESVIDLFIIIFIASIVGSRLCYVGLYWQDFISDPVQIFYINQWGLILYGGALLAALFVWLYTKIKKLKFWKVVDMIVPGLALGLAIGRIGDYLTGSIIGERTDFFLGSFFNGDLRHEPALYLMINAFVLFIFLWLWRPFIKKERVMSYAFLVWYSLARFLIDFTRSSDIIGVSENLYFGLTFSQWFSLVLFVIFTPLLVKKLKTK